MVGYAYKTRAKELPGKAYSDEMGEKTGKAGEISPPTNSGNLP